ncbi:MAG: hypothetical protein J6Y77_00860 [Paludibacteraceae bacterium]|nr:hypothetical protein [Paludibacteraceae bacterium]
MSYLERKLRRIRNKNPRPKCCFINGHDVHSVNLLYEIPDTEVRSAMQKYDDLREVAELCAQRDIRFRAWVYVRKPQWFKPIPEITVLSRKTDHWFPRRPQGRVVRSFMADESDVLMNFAVSQVSTLEQLAEYSQSPFRVSVVREGVHAKYEFMVNMMQSSANLVESFNTVMFYMDTIQTK